MFNATNIKRRFGLHIQMEQIIIIVGDGVISERNSGIISQQIMLTHIIEEEVGTMMIYKQKYIGTHQSSVYLILIYYLLKTLQEAILNRTS